MFIVLITKSYDKSVWCNFSVHCQKEFVRRIEKGILTVSQAETTHYHILARRIAKKYDREYIKGKTR